MVRLAARALVVSAALAGMGGGALAFLPPVPAPAHARAAAGAVLRVPALQAATIPTESQASVAAPVDSPVYKRFGSLKGKAVRTVSESMIEFSKLYKRPVLPQYRILVNELIQSTHLTVVDARFQNDAMLSYGFSTFFWRLMTGYPAEGEADKIFHAIITSIGLDEKKVRDETQAVKEWAEGLTPEKLREALKGEGGGLVAAAASAAKADEFYLYSKMWGLAVVDLMEKAGMELTPDNIADLIKDLGFQTDKAKQDLIQFKEIMDKAAQAEQLFREIEIREKKKMAERLERKAEKALEAAREADQVAESAQ